MSRSALTGFVPPMPYLVCKPEDSTNGSGISGSSGSGQLPVLTGEAIHGAAILKKATAGGLDGWLWNEVQALSLSRFVGLALVLRQIESEGRWPQGLLDAYIASTPLGQRPLCVLPVVYRRFAVCPSSPNTRLVPRLGTRVCFQCSASSLLLDLELREPRTGAFHTWRASEGSHHNYMLIISNAARTIRIFCSFLPSAQSLLSRLRCGKHHLASACFSAPLRLLESV